MQILANPAKRDIGSRSSLVNLEARTLDAPSLARRCVLARLADLTPSLYQQLISQGAAALVVLLPSNLLVLSDEQQKLVHDVEEAMLEGDTQIAVYLAYETQELTDIYESVRTSTNTDSASSAAAALLSSLSSDGYQIVVGGSQSKQISDMSIANVQGKLSGYGAEEQLPTIAVVAYYDAFGAAPELAMGGDSNGSGIVVLLELARILSRLYSSPRTHPRLNVAFLLSGGGYINYQGSKKFLEDHLDASDSSFLSETHFTLCLDTLGNGNTLRLHVSKRPKENSPGHHFYETLESAGVKEGISIEMVHRKINLQEDTQAWEHEKYSMRRLPAFTLSRLTGPKTGERGTILDTVEAVNVDTLTRNTAVIASALLQHIYNTSIDDILEDGLSVTKESITSWIDLIASQPRSPQLLSGKNNPLVSTLHQVLLRYTNEAHINYFKADKRDPEWAFYDVTRAVMATYAVKPAAFDFFLTIAILGYLGIIYMLLQYFPMIYALMSRLAVPQKAKVH
ncbi:hypothetical protein SK128_007587 [Halocaridina rubra]|uniref:BOS complex subunit NCLN n=1 Tax=Halocaridina rubra TaxID=373956 RepID=A0AAN9ABH2_HALRR